jgi:hypothetical protein
MPEKKYTRFGREVTKTKTTVPSASGMGSTTIKSKTVRKGDEMKRKSVVRSDNSVIRSKKMETSKGAVTKMTTKTNAGKRRSVTATKPGEKFTYANLGPVSQVRAFSYQKKKLKK